MLLSGVEHTYTKAYFVDEYQYHSRCISNKNQEVKIGIRCRWYERVCYNHCIWFGTPPLVSLNWGSMIDCISNIRTPLQPNHWLSSIISSIIETGFFRVRLKDYTKNGIWVLKLILIIRDLLVFGDCLKEIFKGTK